MASLSIGGKLWFLATHYRSIHASIAPSKYSTKAVSYRSLSYYIFCELRIGPFLKSRSSSLRECSRFFTAVCSLEVNFIHITADKSKAKSKSTEKASAKEVWSDRPNWFGFDENVWPGGFVSTDPLNVWCGSVLLMSGAFRGSRRCPPTSRTFFFLPVTSKLAS